MKDRAAHALVACSLIRHGLESRHIATLMPALNQQTLPETFHRMISDEKTQRWFRETLHAQHGSILEDAESKVDRLVSESTASHDPVLELFNSSAFDLCGKAVGESPESEKRLLRIVDLHYSHLSGVIVEPHTRDRMQASLWLRDLASSPRLDRPGAVRNHGQRLTRLKLRLAIPPRRAGSPILSTPLLLDSHL